MIERLVQDLRYAARTFRRAPGFLLLTTLTIGVGVGANAAIFSIVNAVLLRPLPFGRPGDLVLVTDSDRRTRQSNGDATPANFLDWRSRQHGFTALAAFRQAFVRTVWRRPPGKRAWRDRQREFLRRARRQSRARPHVCRRATKGLARGVSWC